VFNASSTRPGSLSKWAGLRYGDKFGTSVSIKSQVPVVRTTCFTNDTANFADIVNEASATHSTYYPLQPEYPSAEVSGAVSTRPYSFNTAMYVNSSQIATIWLETPLDEPIGTRISGNSVIGRSSAYLNVQIPDSSGSGGLHAACSIDARWLQSNILGLQAAQLIPDTTYMIGDSDLVGQPDFPAVNDGNWRTVRLGIDWLSALTPELDNATSAWNTLASILTGMGLDKHIVDDSDVASMIAAAVSTVVADGMSRSGYEKNGDGNDSSSRPMSDEELEASYEPMLAGEYVLPSIHEFFDDGNATDKTEMYWSVAVTGLGYRAGDSAANYLSMAVLFIYIILALGHTIWVLYTRETSTAWSSLTDLLTLALMSRPPDSGLENASAGMERLKTLQTPIRIRALTDKASGGGISPLGGGAAVQLSRGVEMIVGTDSSPDIHEAVVIGQEY
ncbi:hypothetical protein QBC46DRAFT_429396, partial [Diplogelasinospora grovesii]